MRLFLAFDLPDALRDRVSEVTASARRTGDDVRWTPPALLHLTVRFLGDVAPERVPALSVAVGAVARRHAPMRLVVEGSGRFSMSGAPRVLWLGVGGEVQALAAFAAEIEAVVVALGFEPEHRAFAPHLTIGRVRRGRAERAVDALEAVHEVGAFDAGELVLFQSERGAEGARHHALTRFPLYSQ